MTALHEGPATTSASPAVRRTADTLWDDVLLPPELLDVRAEARAVAEAVLAPRAYELNTAEESKAAFPHDVMKELAAAGLYEIPYGKDVGGRGLHYPMAATVLVLEELGY